MEIHSKSYITCSTIPDLNYVESKCVKHICKKEGSIANLFDTNIRKLDAKKNFFIKNVIFKNKIMVIEVER